MNYFSMFSGIGGFELGIQRAFGHKSWGEQPTEERQHTKGSELHSESEHSPICIGYSEIDKYAIKVYERNFNGHRNYGDATTINPNDLPDFDLLVGGFPCQAFSVAGKRAGFNDTRGTLFFDIARILSVKRPGHLVLENVKGLLSHDSGKTFQTILGVLADLGYIVEWQVLNSKNFGVPQNRERIYIVGHLGNRCAGQVFPLERAERPHPEARSDAAQRAQGIATRHLGRNGSLTSELASTVQVSETPHVIGSMQSNASVRSHGIVPTSAMGAGGGQIPMIGTINRGSFKETSGVSLTLTATYHKGADNHGARPMLRSDARIRRLTPKECERLQGFPDDWTKYGVGEEPISDTQRYKMCGNAVTVNVVEAVIKGLMPCLS